VLEAARGDDRVELSEAYKSDGWSDIETDDEANPEPG
jgi:hypothetical protein